MMKILRTLLSVASMITEAMPGIEASTLKIHKSF